MVVVDAPLRPFDTRTLEENPTVQIEGPRLRSKCGTSGFMNAAVDRFQSAFGNRATGQGLPRFLKESEREGKVLISFQPGRGRPLGRSHPHLLSDR